MVRCYLHILGSITGKPLCYQDFVVWHSVCSKSIPVKSNTVCGCSGVHCIDLPCEQPIVCAPETSFGTIQKKEQCYSCYSHSQSNVCVPSLPVTFVPMLSLRGISSGRSLQFDTSEIFPCCSRRIFCLFCRKAVRSSTKNAEEHLDGTRNYEYLQDMNRDVNFHSLNTNKTTYRRGFPISLLIVPHSTLVNFLVFKLGKDSLRHRQNSLSPSKRGLSMFE